jgi:hypothetical protein
MCFVEFPKNNQYQHTLSDASAILNVEYTTIEISSVCLMKCNYEITLLKLRYLECTAFICTKLKYLHINYLQLEYSNLDRTLQNKYYIAYRLFLNCLTGTLIIGPATM